MSDRVFLSLAGTTSQLDTLGPPTLQQRFRSSVRRRAVSVATVHALKIGSISPTWDEEYDAFDVWHKQARPLLWAIKPEQAHIMIKRLLPGVQSAGTLPEAEILALLSTNCFELLGSETAPGHWETTRKLRALGVDQVNFKLSWLKRASCRGYELEITTISEPLPSFWIGHLLSQSSRGWARVLEGSSAQEENDVVDSREFKDKQLLTSRPILDDRPLKSSPLKKHWEAIISGATRTETFKASGGQRPFFTAKAIHSFGNCRLALGRIRSP